MKSVLISPTMARSLSADTLANRVKRDHIARIILEMALERGELRVALHRQMPPETTCIVETDQ